MRRRKAASKNENKKEKNKIKEARPHGERSEDGWQEGDLRRHEQLGRHSAQPDHSGTRPLAQVTAAAATVRYSAALPAQAPIASSQLALGDAAGGCGCCANVTAAAGASSLHHA